MISVLRPISIYAYINKLLASLRELLSSLSTQISNGFCCEVVVVHTNQTAYARDMDQSAPGYGRSHNGCYEIEPAQRIPFAGNQAVSLELLVEFNLAGYGGKE